VPFAIERPPSLANGWGKVTVICWLLEDPTSPSEVDSTVRWTIDIWDGTGSRWCSVLAKVDCCRMARVGVWTTSRSFSRLRRAPTSIWPMGPMGPMGSRRRARPLSLRMGQGGGSVSTYAAEAESSQW
jgi:hypothetical protein